MHAWCGCVCIGVGVYAWVWVCMYGCGCVCMGVCMHGGMGVYVYAWVCMGVGVYAWMHGTVCRGMKGDSQNLYSLQQSWYPALQVLIHQLGDGKTAQGNNDIQEERNQHTCLLQLLYTSNNTPVRSGPMDHIKYQ